MKKYIGTFYTHFGALTFFKTLEKLGIDARLTPVPRKLSSSCGTCVQFFASEPVEPTGVDWEAVYLCENDEYKRILNSDV